MLSRGILVGSMLLMAALQGGCSLIDDEPAAGGLESVGPRQPDCLTSLPNQLGKFFEGELQDDAQIEGLWECAAQGMETFMLLTRGSENGIYAPSEVQSFLNRYFTKEQWVTDPLVQAAMKLKVAFLGGGVSGIPRVEVERLVTFLRLVKRYATGIKVLMPLSGTRTSRLSEDELQRGIDAMRGATAAFGAFFQEHGGAYSFADAEQLFAALEGGYEGLRKPGSGVKLIREQMPVLRHLKRIFLNSDEGGIAQGEWARFLNFGARIHAIYFEFQYQHSRRQTDDWFTESGLGQIEQIAGRAVDLLTDAAAAHPQGVVQPRYMEALVDTLARMKTDRGLDSVEMVDAVSDIVALMMVAKQAFFGGPVYEWDLNHAILLKGFMATVKHPVWIAYNNFIKRKDEVPGMAQPEFERLMSEVTQSVDAVSRALVALRGARNHAETLETMRALLARVNTLFKTEDERALIHETVGFLFQAKAVLVGPPRNRIETPDWGALISNAEPLTRAYLLSLRGEDASAPQDERQIRRFWPVIERAYESLSRAAHATPEGIRASDVLTLIDLIPHRFIDEIFPDKRDVPWLRAMVPEIFALKSGLVGGVDGNLTGAEFDALFRIATASKEAMLSLLHYFPFTLDELKRWPEAHVEELASQLDLAGRRVVGAFTGVTPGSYELSRAARVLDLLTWRFDGDSFRKAKDYIPLFGAFKAVFIRPSQQRLEGRDWVDTVSRSTRWAAASIRFIHLTSNYRGLSHGRDLARFSELVITAFDLLRDATLSRGGPSISSSSILFADWDHLFDEAYAFADREKITTPLTIATTKAFFRPAVRRILGGVRWDDTGRNANGLRTEALDYARDRFERWSMGAQYLDRTYRDISGDNEAVFESDGFSRRQLLDVFARFRREAETASGTPAGRRQMQLSTLDRLRDIVSQLRPMYLGTDDIVALTYDQRREFLYSYANMAAMNTHWVLISSWIHGYSENKDRAVNLVGITEDELLHFVVDSMDLIRELKFGNPYQTPEALAAQRFFENNLFTSVGNGDKFFGLIEAVEYLSFLMSANTMSTKIYDELLAVCPNLDLDYADRPMLPMTCFRAYFFEPARFHAFFTRYVPWMAYYFTTLNETQRRKFTKDLEAAARPVGATDEVPVDSSQMQNFAILPFYVESMFKRFDDNRSGVLSVPEALEAYPLVCPLILKVSLKADGTPRFSADCTPGETGFVEAVFGYLLKNGYPPPSTSRNLWDDIEQTLNFLGWNAEWWMIKNVSGLRFTVDRGRIMSIVGSLAVQQAVPAPPPPRAPSAR